MALAQKKQEPLFFILLHLQDKKQIRARPNQEQARTSL